MLPKIYRLKKDKEIKRVFAKGKGYRGDFLFIKLVKNDFKASRFAFIINRKVAKKSAPRNKLKRRLRETVKALLPKVKIGLDVVVAARKGAAVASPEELTGEVEKLFKKAKLT